MKTTVSQLDFQEAMDNWNCGFSNEGSEALFNYLEELEQDCGMEFELDPVAIRCEYTEYEDIEECLADYGKLSDCMEANDIEDSNELTWTDCIQYLEDFTVVIEFDNGVIIQNF